MTTRVADDAALSLYWWQRLAQVQRPLICGRYCWPNVMMVFQPWTFSQMTQYITIVCNLSVAMIPDGPKKIGGNICYQTLVRTSEFYENDIFNNDFFIIVRVWT